MDNTEGTLIENIIKIAERVGKKLPLARHEANDFDRIFFTDVEVLVDQIIKLANTINKKV